MQTGFEPVFEQAVTHPGVTFEIVFGVSRCDSWKMFDLEHGREAIGYYPQDTIELTPDAQARLRDGK